MSELRAAQEGDIIIIQYVTSYYYMSQMGRLVSASWLSIVNIWLATYVRTQYRSSHVWLSLTSKRADNGSTYFRNWPK